MYRAMCKCGGHVDFNRHEHHFYRCNQCRNVIVWIENGSIQYRPGTRIKGYFKAGDVHASTHQ